MTGFDETAADNDLDEQRPEHDSANPALEDGPDPDEAPMGGDDDLQAGQIGPDTPQPQDG